MHGLKWYVFVKTDGGEGVVPMEGTISVLFILAFLKKKSENE